MIRSQRSWTLAALFVLLACDGDKPAPKSAPKPEAAAKAEKAGEAKKVADAEAGGGKATPAAEKHFDVTKDRSGVLARSAAVLEATDKIDNENLHVISHNAQTLPSFERVCAHEAKIKGDGFDVPGCVKATEHYMVQLGPELYEQLAACMLSAETGEEIDACVEAEAEAEKQLHDQPRGDGLSKEVCDGLFSHFEALAIEDSAEQRELVKEILEEVRADVLVVCMEQGTQAEIDCSMKAKAMPALKECASKLL